MDPTHVHLSNLDVYPLIHGKSDLRNLMQLVVRTAVFSGLIDQQ